MTQPLNMRVYEKFLGPASEKLNAAASLIGGFLPPEPRKNLAAFLQFMTPRPHDVIGGAIEMMKGVRQADPNAALGGLSLMAMGAMDAVPGGKGARAAGDAAQGISTLAKDTRPYANTPDSLMGYKRSGQNDFNPNYKFRQVVKVILPNGEEFYDVMSGLNRPHAIERAARNWDGSTVVGVSRDELPDWARVQIAPFLDK